MQTNEDVDSQLVFVFEQVLARKPSGVEATILRNAFEKQRAFYKGNENLARKVVDIGEAIRDRRLNVVDHAAMTAVCAAVFNMDEALTRE